MKVKVKVLVSLVAVVTLLTACGGSSGGSYSNDGFYSNGFTSGVASDGYYESSWNSGTYINGENVDYNYTFSAEGTTRKTREYMLGKFEEFQDLVNENGGYISDVRNWYNSYVIEPDDTYISEYQRCYVATGQLRFTAEINNENIPVVVDYLEEFCKSDNFTVTAYNQTIKNYDGYTVVNDKDDIDWWDYDHKITDEELQYRTRYAELYVTIDYYIPRNIFAKTFYGLRGAFMEFWDASGTIISAFAAIGVGFIVWFCFAVVFYKRWKKIVHLHKKKHPEYYDAKKVIIIDDTDKSMFYEGQN